MELKKEVESLLFSSGKVMSEKELAELTRSSESEVKTALDTLKQEYDDRDTSLMLVNTGDKWKLNVREKYVDLVTKIIADTELPFPVLETLAVIAYKAPVLQADIIKIRGTNAYEHMSVLVKEEFVEKRKEGRSFRISLTQKFFKYFDVEGEHGIKEVLKDVKVPEKVGDLKVVDVPEEKRTEGEEKIKEKIGDLEVVDEIEEPIKKINIDDHKPDLDFLDNLDKKISDVRDRNDELDGDELFKRQEEINKELEEGSEGETAAGANETPREEETSEEEKETAEEKEEEGVGKEIADIAEELEKEKKEIAEKDEESAEEGEDKSQKSEISEKLETTSQTKEDF